jgi:hypothetical protein
MRTPNSLFPTNLVPSARAFAVAAIIAFALTGIASAETAEAPAKAPAAPATEAVLELQMTLLSFDAIRGEAEARTTVVPKGAMADKDGLPTQNLRVVDTESVVSNEIDIKQGRQIPAVVT